MVIKGWIYVSYIPQGQENNKNFNNISKYQIEINEMKYIVTELKSSIKGFKSRLDESSANFRIRQKVIS